jgi:threonine/homoserine/homoserine lactone efflux protein
MTPLLPLLAFAFATSITPGPNNAMVMMTAANWGFRASLPAFFGVEVGFMVLMLATGLGLGELFIVWPLLHIILKWGCFGWLLVLAWKLALARSHDVSSGSKERPLTFFQMVLFQWINPKAWMMTIGAVALFVPVGADPLMPVLRVILAYILAGAPCVLMWASFGVAISRFLTSPRRVRAFNVTMAVLLVLSMLPTVF